MPKSRRTFNKHNSQKFVLITEGRNEDGEKITQNCLMPVSYNHVPGHTLLISKLEGVCGPPIEPIKKGKEKVVEKLYSSRKKTESESSINEPQPDLEGIMDQFACSDDEEWETDEEDEQAPSRYMDKMHLFDDEDGDEGTSKPQCAPSKVRVEILDEGSDLSDYFDEDGQFLDAESDDEDLNKKKFLNRFLTKKSLTSSREDCPENIRMLNEGFEKILEEYQDECLGDLEGEEICGTFSTENEHVQNFINSPLDKKREPVIIGDCGNELKNKILNYSETEETEKTVEIVIEKPLDWDCESILSTYSNIYNHPAVIEQERKVRNIRIPNNPLQKKLTKSMLRQLDSVSENSQDEEGDEDDRCSVTTSCNIRHKNETPEQKRERKALFKEAKRESRKLKKENKLAFKQEMKFQKSQELNVRNNQGTKLL